jgi:hypothetical protein
VCSSQRLLLFSVIAAFEENHSISVISLPTLHIYIYIYILPVNVSSCHLLRLDVKLYVLVLQIWKPLATNLVVRIQGICWYWPCMVFHRPGSEAWPWVWPPRAQPMKGPRIFVGKHIYRHVAVCSPVAFYAQCFGSQKTFCGSSYATAAQINMIVLVLLTPTLKGPECNGEGWDGGMRWEGSKFQHLFCKEPKSTYAWPSLLWFLFPKSC